MSALAHSRVRRIASLTVGVIEPLEAECFDGSCCTALSWRDCYDDSCAIHVVDKEEFGSYPFWTREGSSDPMDIVLDPLDDPYLSPDDSVDENRSLSRCGNPLSRCDERGVS